MSWVTSLSGAAQRTRKNSTRALVTEEVMKSIRWSLGGCLLVFGAFSAAACERRTTPRDEAERLRSAPPAEPRAEGTDVRTERTTDDPGRTTAVEENVRKATAKPESRKAVDSITAARCDREQRCNNVGSGKKYETRDACVTKVQSDWQAELNAFECPQGIVQPELDECLDEIRTEGCANPFEALSRVAACRQGEICRRG
jgi:hypothetical protein